MRLPYIFAIITLIPSLAQMMPGNDVLMVLLIALLITVNLMALLKPRRFPLLLPVSANTLDATMAIYVAWSMSLAGKVYLPYMYIIAGFGFVFVAGLLLYRNLTSYLQ